MSTETIETRDGRQPAELANGTRIAGLLGLAKLLLLLAPFVAIRSCSGSTPRPITGVQVVEFAAGSLRDPLLILFLLVPLSGLIAVALFGLSFRRPVDQFLRPARWMLAAAAASLVGLANAAIVAVYLDAEQSPQFLWGFWGIAGSDVLTIILLSTLIVWPTAVKPDQAPGQDSDHIP